MYYFHLHDADNVDDSDGTDLPDLDAVRAHAVGVVNELKFRRDSMLNRRWSRWTMSVCDSNGQEVLSLGLGDVRDARGGNGS